jgi:hypothetical protein
LIQRKSKWDNGHKPKKFGIRYIDSTQTNPMFGCYIICSEILVEVNQLTILVEVDQDQVKDQGGSMAGRSRGGLKTSQRSSALIE